MAALRGKPKYSNLRRKSMYSVHGNGVGRTATACSVKKNGRYYLLTWCCPGEDFQPITIHRYCSQYPNHAENHVLENLPLDRAEGGNGLTFVPLNEPEFYLDIAELPLDQKKVKAYTFQGKKVLKLKFRRNVEGSYELEKKSRKRNCVEHHVAKGAPIIIREAGTRKPIVVGVLDETLSPVFYSNTAAASRPSGGSTTSVSRECSQQGLQQHQPSLPVTNENPEASRPSAGSAVSVCGEQSQQGLQQHQPSLPVTNGNHEGGSSERSFDVKKYRAQLAEHYKERMSHVRRTPWNPRDTVPIDDIYTRLCWVEDGEQLDDYSELFKANEDGTKPKRILVEGDAGMGKSTHAQKIAADWARGKNALLQQFELIIFVLLRRVREKKTLEEALEASGLFSNDDPPKFDDLYEYVKQNQEKVLFLFDGYDEYDPCDDDPTKHATHITQIMEGSRLKQCRVLVTTRPWRADELKPYQYTHAKITGFNEYDMVQFCIKFFKDKAMGKQVVWELFLSDLLDIAAVPLLLLFLCLLRQDERTLPKDRIELYKKTVECILNHNKARGRNPVSESMQMHKRSLCCIGKVAFDALMKNSVLFDYAVLPEEVRSDDVLRLGFLSVTSTVSAYPEMKISFLHKSLQEFLAAWYVQNAFVDEFLSVLKTLDCTDLLGHLSGFIAFLSQLSEECRKAVFWRMQEIMQTDDFPRQFSHASFWDMNRLAGFDRLRTVFRELNVAHSGRGETPV